MSASREKKLRQDQSASGDGLKSFRTREQEAAQRKSDRRYQLGIAAFVLLAAITLLWNSNLIPRTVPAVTIDGKNYSAAEVLYYYQSAIGNFSNSYGYFVSFFGVDLTSPLKGQSVEATAASLLGVEEGTSWFSYMMDAAIDEMTRIQRGLEAAEGEGFQFPQSVEENYTTAMQNLRSNAAASGLSVNALLQRSLGKSMTEKIYSRQLLRQLQYEAYRDAYTDSLTYSRETIDERYQENPDNYDKVSWEYVVLSAAAESTTAEDGTTVDPTEAEQTAAKEAARAIADEILEDYQSGGDLEQAAQAHEEATYYESEDTAYSTDETAAWLFDAARQAGDAQVLEVDSSYYVAVFRGRSRNESNTVNVRHILIVPGSGTKSDGDEGYQEEQEALAAAARTEAEELLAQWKAGEATEDSFAALAREKSADQGSSSSGGLIADISDESSLVEDFKDWSLDPSRQPGDTGVVDSTYGSHVMYFVNVGVPVWESQVIGDLKSSDLGDWLEALVKDVSAQQQDFGMKFVS